MESHHFSSLSRERLSMMGDDNHNGSPHRQQSAGRCFISGHTAKMLHQQRTPKQTIPSPTPSPDGSWRGGVISGAALDELEAISTGKVSPRQSTRARARVRFDESANHAKTREMAVIAENSLLQNQTFRFLDMMNSSFCNSFELPSPSRSSLEKRMATSPIFRTFMSSDEDDDSSVFGSESESEITDRSSPETASRQSFGECFPDVSAKVNDPSESESKSLLFGAASERKSSMGEVKNCGNHSLVPSNKAPMPDIQTSSILKAIADNNHVSQQKVYNGGNDFSSIQITRLLPVSNMTSSCFDQTGINSSKRSKSEGFEKSSQRQTEAAALVQPEDIEDRENAVYSYPTREKEMPITTPTQSGNSAGHDVWSHDAVSEQPLTAVPFVSMNSTVSCLTDDATPDGIDEESKVCVPSLFQKRLQMLKKLKESKRKNSLQIVSQSSTASTFINPALSSSVIEAVLIGSSRSSEKNEDPKLSAEEKSKLSLPVSSVRESNRHAYVAYFEQGLQRAQNMIRIYEHQIPRRFPTDGCQIVVRVGVSTISVTDTFVRRGEYWGISSKSPLDLPIIPGVAFVGEVVQIDKAASRSGLKLGDRVVSLVRSGANARHVTVHPGQVVKIPSQINFVDAGMAACLPEIYLTAFQALHIDRKHGSRYSKSGLADKSILILGGTTALGRALCELAAVGGAGTVYATARQQQYQVVEKFGAIPISRDPHQWFSLLVGKMDYVVCVDNAINNSSELKYEHIQTLGHNGKLVLIGHPDKECSKKVDLSTFDEQSVGTSRKLYNYNVFNQWNDDVKLAKKDLLHLVQLLAERRIEPRILETLPLADVARVHEILDKASLGGFVLCEPWLDERNPKETSSNKDPLEEKIRSTLTAMTPTKATGF